MSNMREANVGCLVVVEGVGRGWRSCTTLLEFALR